jgi:hypothetical protein
LLYGEHPAFVPFVIRERRPFREGGPPMSSKRQQTLAKLTRERTVKERRERKQEKKRLRKLEAAERSEAPIDDDVSTAAAPDTPSKADQE